MTAVRRCKGPSQVSEWNADCVRSGPGRRGFGVCPELWWSSAGRATGLRLGRSRRMRIYVIGLRGMAAVMLRIRVIKPSAARARFAAVATFGQRAAV